MTDWERLIWSSDLRPTRNSRFLHIQSDNAIKGEDHKGVSDGSSEDKSKIRNNKDTDNSITEELFDASQATKGKNRAGVQKT